MVDIYTLAPRMADNTGIGCLVRVNERTIQVGFGTPSFRMSLGLTRDQAIALRDMLNEALEVMPDA